MPILARMNTAPDLAAMERFAREALRTLPEPFSSHVEEIVLRVADFATAEQLAAVGLADRWELTGLYEGVALTERTSWDLAPSPAEIWLFREPILAEWRETGVALDALVRHVVIHEAGHHFGLSDDDMHALEDAAGER